MGANPTQAYGIALFFIAFTLIAIGFAMDVSVLAFVLGFAALAASVAVFQKCKPWEHQEE